MWCLLFPNLNWANGCLLLLPTWDEWHMWCPYCLWCLTSIVIWAMPLPICCLWWFFQLAATCDAFFLTEHNAWMNWDGIGMNFDKLGWIWDLFFDTVLSVWHLRWWFFVKLIKTCAEAVACNDVVLLVLRQRRWDSSSFMHINSRSSSPVPPPLSLLLPLSLYNTILWCDAILSYFWWRDQVGLYLILFLNFYCCLWC